ncbi:MAG: DNA replication and repair protein RecF [Flavobacteriaceae bacterium]|nr:DNA replication and repair protein RecF [Flavobacteriaceae bacterium]|tara:strand:+ start:2464 stop:3543 length:1080 start_codon:yes stop_codon:yes gene_type:complete
MLVKKINLTNYKNLSSRSYTFNSSINCFVGNNGKGKSNILDSIYHLAFGKSFFNSTTAQNIMFNKKFFLIEGKFEINSREEKITCSYKKGQKKVLKRNNIIYEKFSEHIGLIPLVLISPDDIDLINDGSALRRKFIDGILGQIFPEYLKNLIDYNKLLSQRNSLLKYFASNQTFDHDSIEIYDLQLEKLGKNIHKYRNKFIRSFSPLFLKRYKKISKGNEIVMLNYKSSLNNSSFGDLLKNSINKDRLFQYTTEGIHKDDIELLIHQKPIKKFGSQGQKKTYLISLKIAQFDYLKDKKGVSPIVLLDDIFDKLDQDRVTNLLKLIIDENFGQIFLTDTHEKRTLKTLKSVNSDFEIFKV